MSKLKKATTSTVTSRTPVQDRVAEAEAAGEYLIAVWYLKDGTMHFYRMTERFPLAEFQPAVEMLRADLDKEKAAATTT